MTLQWKNAADFEEPLLRCFFYGPTRSGKSVLSSTFPMPIFGLPANEGSIESLKGSDIPYVLLGTDPLKVIEDMRELIESLYVKSKSMPKEQFQAEVGKTLVMDNLSHLSDMMVLQLTNGGKIVPNQQTWGALRTHLLWLRDAAWRLPMHVVFTSLEKVTTDDRGAVTDAGPRVPGAAGELLPSSCSAVGVTEQTYGNPPKFLVHFRRFGHFSGGARFMPPCTLESGTAPGTTIFDQMMAFAMANAKKVPT